MWIESIRRVFIPSFLGDVESEQPITDPIFGAEVTLVEFWVVRVWSNGPKLNYRNSESFPKFEFRMSL